MPITYDIEKDGLYQKGIKKGVKQGEERQLKKSILALHKEQMSVSRIARILATPADKVLRIIEEWEAEQSG